METLLGLPSLQLVVEQEAMQAAYILHCSNHSKKSDWRHSAIFRMATEDFPVLLAPSDSMLPLEVFDRKYLVEYHSSFLLMSSNSILMALCVRAGRVLKFFLEELDLKASFALATFATVFQTEVYTIMACSDYCLGDCMTGKMICIWSDSQSGRFMNVKLAHSVIEAGASVPELSVGTFYS
jgi:hypothetical protein